VDPDSLNPDLDQAFKVNPDAVPDPDPDWIRIQGFYQKLPFTYVQATGEDFSPQKRTSSTSKN
jgi:hypothetical protein